jgi:hypothetical protein
MARMNRQTRMQTDRKKANRLNRWVSRGARCGIPLLLFLVAYVMFWSDAKGAVVHILYRPVLEHAVPEHGTVAAVQASARAVSVHLGPAWEGVTRPLPAPAGARFLLAGGVVIALAPNRPYWLILWIGHLALGGLAVCGWALALQGASVGAYGALFVQTYLLDAFSLFVPALVITRTAPWLRPQTERRRRTETTRFG